MNLIYFFININYKIKIFFFENDNLCFLIFKIILCLFDLCGKDCYFKKHVHFHTSNTFTCFQILFLFWQFLIKIIKVTNQLVGRMKCINSIRIIYSVKIKQSVPFVLCRWFQCKKTVSDLAEHDWSSTTLYMYIHN